MSKLNKGVPMNIYWTSVEFDIKNPSDYEDCIGGFVYLFLRADDVRDALVKIQDAVEAEGLVLTHVEFISLYDQIPWDSEEDQMQYDELAKEAGVRDEVVWDEILAYESRDE
jgi:hypothetical protein